MTRNATGDLPAIISKRCGSCSSRTKPDDYVISTGETHSVKEFVEVVFKYLDMDWHEYVEIDERYFRPY